MSARAQSVRVFAFLKISFCARAKLMRAERGGDNAPRSPARRRAAPTDAAMIASIITRVNLRRDYGRIKAGICEGRASLRGGGRRRQVDALVWRTPGVRARLETRRVRASARDTRLGMGDETRYRIPS